jgi:hypothetical protein
MTPTPFRLDPSFRAGRSKRRLVRVMACGVEAAKAAAKLGITDEELDRITADPDFPDLLAAYRRLYGRPREEILAELESIALTVLLDAVEEREPKVCAWYFRERQHGRDPCVTLAESVVRARERAEREEQKEPEAAPPPTAKPRKRPPYDDLEALRHRITVSLRDKVIVEAASMEKAKAPAAPTTPIIQPEPVAPALTRRPEAEIERDLNRVLAKLMGKRVRDRELDTS